MALPQQIWTVPNIFLKRREIYSGNKFKTIKIKVKRSQYSQQYSRTLEWRNLFQVSTFKKFFSLHLASERHGCCGRKMGSCLSRRRLGCI